MRTFGYILLLVIVGVIGVGAGIFIHARYGESEPSKATLEAAAIAQARETARLQFERDIGLAETQLRAANESLQELTSQPAVTPLYAEEYTKQQREVQAGRDEVEKKRDRLAFLRKEAARLNIPVSAAETLADAPVVVMSEPTAPPAPEVTMPETIPNMVTLMEPVEVRDPASSQMVKFGRGRMFRVIDMTQTEVTVQYLEHQITLPLVATNLKY